jgi:hypothetical protein
VVPPPPRRPRCRSAARPAHPGHRTRPRQATAPWTAPEAPREHPHRHQQPHRAPTARAEAGRAQPCSTAATPTARAAASASSPRSTAGPPTSAQIQRVRHRPGRRVDHSFLYRHRDLLEKIHALAAEHPATTSERAGPAVTRTSLQADLLAAHERAARLHNRVQHLERRLSDALGERAWHASGLGAPADIDALHQQITRLEQQVIELGLQLAERDEDLAAARATNREFMARINASHPTR